MNKLWLDMGFGLHVRNNAQDVSRKPLPDSAEAANTLPASLLAPAVNV